MLFNPSLHEYSDDGIIIRSVTQILWDAGIIDDTWYSREARERGSAVHELCERYANGERVGKTGIPLADYEYVNAFAKWISDTGAYPIELECVISGMVNGKRYAGKFDGLYEIAGKRVLIDIKTGVKAKWHAIQLAAYGMGKMVNHPVFPDSSVNPDKCAVLYLKADGSYKYEAIPGSRLVEAIREFKEAIDARN